MTSIKFQAFIQLGCAPYDNHIKPFLISAAGETLNRIDEAPFQELLVYNGVDSLVEYKVAIKQMEKFSTC